MIDNNKGQFAFVDQVGIINSNRLMKILRHTRKHGPLSEGELAGKCCERLFFPEWPSFINQLLQWGYIEVKPTGKGNYRSISLTSCGEEFMEHTIGPKEVEQPTEVTHETATR